MTISQQLDDDSSSTGTVRTDAKGFDGDPAHVRI